jgi:hypothetical protein
MNERIKELAEQADSHALKTIGDKWVGWEEIAPGWVECRDSKFAELIVWECARAVDKVYEDAEPDHGCYDWATWAEGADVLKHFGVEE